MTSLNAGVAELHELKGFPVQVAEGDTVHWVNNDPATHTATADNGEFDSGDLGQGDAFDHIFNGPPRTVSYGCQYHPGMRGAITVT